MGESTANKARGGDEGPASTKKFTVAFCFSAPFCSAENTDCDCDCDNYDETDQYDRGDYSLNEAIPVDDGGGIT